MIWRPGCHASSWLDEFATVLPCASARVARIDFSSYFTRLEAS
jgi:hypothetical protein